MEKLNKKINFLLEIGRAFHRYGTNAPRLELILTRIAEAIGLEGSFFSTPTYLAISIEDEQGGQITRHIRVTPGKVDLAKLSDVDEIADEVSLGNLNISEAMKELIALRSVSTSFGAPLTICAFGVISLSLGVIFGAAFKGILCAGFIGAVLGFFLTLISKSENLDDLSEILGAFICTALAYTAKIFIPEVNFQVVLMAALISIIPGLGLTIALTELAAKNLVSGTARLMGAVVSFFKISFGVMAALQLMGLLKVNVSLHGNTAQNGILLLPAVILGGLAFGIIFKARIKDFKWILISGCIAIFSIKFLNVFTSDVMSILGGSLSVGIGSNFFARHFKRPAMIPLLPGIIFLVPGSIGYTGMNLIFNTEYSQGVSTAFQMFVIAITIVSGLFFSNILVNPRKAL